MRSRVDTIAALASSALSPIAISRPVFQISQASELRTQPQTQRLPPAGQIQSLKLRVADRTTEAEPLPVPPSPLTVRLRGTEHRQCGRYLLEWVLGGSEGLRA